MTDQDSPILLTVAVLGGTGKEGSGLAARWARSGYRVLIGSRDAQRAQQKADELNTALGGSYLIGTDNHSAAQEAAIVVLSVPYDAHTATLEALKDVVQGKIVVDVTVPLNPPKVRTVYLPEGKSASLEAQAILGPGVKIVTAFQNVSAHHLGDPNHSVACDVLICGDDEQAKEDVIQLAQAAGMRGLDAGPLANSVAVEALTPVLLYMNRKYKVPGAGIVITGIDES
jgi:8-hydroxy-5-deazaflavin:NADPH oxidoreductase